jgi:hypothetical protein
VNGLLVRVGADQSAGGGAWNDPVDSASGEFVYVAIPESRPVHVGAERPYAALAPSLAHFGISLPTALQERRMHLDPDFAHLTYGDQGERAKQLRAALRPGDFIAFYAGLADTCGASRLIYALIGLLVVERIERAVDVPRDRRDLNAHTRRVLAEGAEDVVVHGRPGVSGRLRRCLPIGEWRDRAYRVRRNLLEVWGGVGVRNGYLQRSARLPRLLDPQRFLGWLREREPMLMQTNN